MTLRCHCPPLRLDALRHLVTVGRKQSDARSDAVAYFAAKAAKLAAPKPEERGRRGSLGGGSSGRRPSFEGRRPSFDGKQWRAAASGERRPSFESRPSFDGKEGALLSSQSRGSFDSTDALPDALPMGTPIKRSVAAQMGAGSGAAGASALRRSRDGTDSEDSPAKGSPSGAAGSGAPPNGRRGSSFGRRGSFDSTASQAEAAIELDREHEAALEYPDDFDALEAATSDGLTPVIKAAQMGQLAAVELLKDLGADINALDRTGRTALDWAETGDRKPIVDFFSKNGGERGTVMRGRPKPAKPTPTKPAPKMPTQTRSLDDRP